MAMLLAAVSALQIVEYPSSSVRFNSLGHIVLETTFCISPNIVQATEASISMGVVGFQPSLAHEQKQIGRPEHQVSNTS